MIDGEEKLIQDAVKEGDSSAFGKLYDHYQPMIYRFVLIKVGRREEAEDITHQVFLQAWQNIRTYRHRGHPFGSWLYRIARNQVIDHYRSRKDDVPLEADGRSEMLCAAKPANRRFFADGYGTGHGRDPSLKTRIPRRYHSSVLLKIFPSEKLRTPCIKPRVR